MLFVTYSKYAILSSSSFILLSVSELPIFICLTCFFLLFLKRLEASFVIGVEDASFVNGAGDAALLEHGFERGGESGAAQAPVRDEEQRGNAELLQKRFKVFDAFKGLRFAVREKRNRGVKRQLIYAAECFFEWIHRVFPLLIHDNFTRSAS